MLSLGISVQSHPVFRRRPQHAAKLRCGRGEQGLAMAAALP